MIRNAIKNYLTSEESVKGRRIKKEGNRQYFLVHWEKWLYRNKHMKCAQHKCLLWAPEHVSCWLAKYAVKKVNRWLNLGRKEWIEKVISDRKRKREERRKASISLDGEISLAKRNLQITYVEHTFAQKSRMHAKKQNITCMFFLLSCGSPLRMIGMCV